MNHNRNKNYAARVFGALSYGRAQLIDMDYATICRDEQDSWHLSQAKQRVVLVVRRRRGKSVSIALHPVELENVWTLLEHWQRQNPRRYKIVREVLDQEPTRKFRWSPPGTADPNRGR